MKNVASVVIRGHAAIDAVIEILQEIKEREGSKNKSRNSDAKGAVVVRTTRHEVQRTWHLHNTAHNRKTGTTPARTSRKV